MKNTHFIGLFAFLSILLLFTCNQQIFQAKYDAGLIRSPSSIASADNRDMIILGGSGSHCYLLKTDRNGDPIWNKTFDVGINGYQSQMIFADNGSIMVLGGRNAYPTLGISLQKHSSNGNFLWGKIYEHPSVNILGKAMIETSDFGYLITGSTYGTGKLFMMKLDVTGAVQWANTYPTSSSMQGSSVTELANGNYAIVSEWYNSGAVVLVVNPSGVPVWAKLGYDDDGLYFTGKDIIADGNDLLITAAADNDAALVKLDQNGNVDWAKKYQIAGDLHDFNIIKNNEGNYVILGATEFSSPGVFMMKVNDIGSPIWMRKYDPNTYLSHVALNNSHSNMSAVQLYDQGYAFAGSYGSFSDLYLVRTNEEGNTPCGQISYVPSATDLDWEDGAITLIETPQTISSTNFTPAFITPNFAKTIICQQPNCVDPPASITAWYPFDFNGVELVFQNDAVPGSGANPAFVTSPVLGAAQLDGIDDYFTVPSSSATNFGTGDFSIDFWVKVDPIHAGGKATVLDKLDLTGVELYLDNGILHLTLDDGSSGTFSSTVNIADNSWHFVAISVSRSNSVGGRWYIDGDLKAVFDPTVQNHSLSNNSSLLIGRRTSTSDPQFFKGEIDELEFYEEAILSPTFKEIYAAGKYGSIGKCQTAVQLPEYSVLCSGDNKALVNITVCNYGPVDRNYEIGTLNGLPSGLWTGCDVDGPTNYTVLTTTPILVTSGTCGIIQVEIDRPSALNTPYDKACYEISIVSDNNITNWASGKLIDLSSTCLTLSGSDNPTVISLAENEATAFSFQIENTSNRTDTIQYELVVSSVDKDETATKLRLSTKRSESLAVLSPREKATVPFELLLEEKHPFRSYRVTFNILDAKTDSYVPAYTLKVK